MPFVLLLILRLDTGSTSLGNTAQTSMFGVQAGPTAWHPQGRKSWYGSMLASAVYRDCTMPTQPPVASAGKADEPILAQQHTAVSTPPGGHPGSWAPTERPQAAGEFSSGVPVSASAHVSQGKQPDSTAGLGQHKAGCAAADVCCNDSLSLSCWQAVGATGAAGSLQALLAVAEAHDGAGHGTSGSQSQAPGHNNCQQLQAHVAEHCSVLGLIPSWAGHLSSTATNRTLQSVPSTVKHPTACCLQRCPSLRWVGPLTSSTWVTVVLAVCALRT